MLNLKIIENKSGATFEVNMKRSKIDHIIMSKNLCTNELILHRSISDHKILSIKINNVKEVQRNTIKLINRKIAKDLTQSSLYNSQKICLKKQIILSILSRKSYLLNRKSFGIISKR